MAAKKTKVLPNQTHYDCLGCGKTKESSEFYVNRKRTNGLQAYCKSCCKEKNSEFRVKRPSYYWDAENQLGYLQKNYDKFKEIVRKSNSADKTNKIYAIPTPEGTYIGATSRHIFARKANHKWQYFGYRNNPNKLKIPGLYEVFDKYPFEMVEIMINSMYILEEWEGDRKELMQKETEYIQQWNSEGKPLLNTMKVK
jgi:transcription elongation factor Elf1